MQYLLGKPGIAGIAAIVLFTIGGNQLDVSQILGSTVIAMTWINS